MTTFGDETVNNKAFEHANLIFTEPWALANEVMLNIMQTLNLVFSKRNLRHTQVYVLNSIFKTLHNFSRGFFPVYRGILEPKSNTSILRKNGLFSKKTCYGLTSLFQKRKFTFVVNKQISKNS